jgi:cysteine desulfurase
VAGHKLYAPKGVGALYVRDGVRVATFMHGAGHESGRRAGTENVLLIVGLGQAAEIAARDLDHNRTHMQTMRDRLYAALRAAFPPEIMRLNGPEAGRLPNTLSVSFRNVEANTLLAQIADRVAASAGAACHADRITVSHVLEAMGVPVEYAMGTVRLSVGTPTTADEVDRAAAVIIGAVRGMV